jgi:hypothetical protein
MRTYVGSVDHCGLRQFLAEDRIPAALLRELLVGWFSRSTTVIWAVVADVDAEAIHQEIRAGSHRVACSLLLNFAVEILPLASISPDLTNKVRH